MHTILNINKKFEQNNQHTHDDWLSEKEANFTKRIVKDLEKYPWAKKLLSESKITRAINFLMSTIPMRKTPSDISEIKSALFEVRFAYSILGLAVEYEYSCGMGDSTVDFKIEKDGFIWLVELTSCRTSSAVKDSTIYFLIDQIAIQGEIIPTLQIL